MELSFLQPAFAVALLALPALWLLPWRPRSLIQGLLRSLALALVALALMQPVMLSQFPREQRAILLDQSASLGLEAQAEGAEVARQLAERFQQEGGLSLLQLGGDAPLAIGEQSTHLQPRDGSESPLGDALLLAAQSIPRGMRGSVTLISDGLATDRHWGRALDQLLERGIPVHAYDLSAPPQDPLLADLRLSETRLGETARAWAQVQGDGSGLQVRLKAGDEILAASDPFASAGQRRVELQFEAKEAGFLDLTAELIAPPGVDDDPSNNQRKALLAVQDPVQALHLGERQQQGAQRLADLLGAGFALRSVAAAELDGAFDLSAYDLALLDDLPARSLSEAAQQQLASAVQEQGLGLAFSGGEASFGDGGYRDTPIAELLPVELPGDEDRVDPSVGLAIILDTSGSMAGARIELAKQIARIAVRRMQPHDRIGIVEFYGAKHWAVPMQPASNKIEIDRAIGRMKAIGGTVLYPAIQEAFYGLQNVNTRYKHILVITDAGVEDSNYEAMVRRISRDRINLSSILVGQGGHNQIMSDMANWGQGRFYSVGDQFSLVELILKQPSAKKPSKYKRGLFQVQGLGGPGWWGELDQAGIPPLQGYVETELRPGAELLLKERRREHPLLATWQYGLGRVTALMTEPVGAGTARWAGWQDYGQFLGRALGRTAADGAPFDLQLQRRHGLATLRALRLMRGPAEPPAAQLVDAAGAPLAEPPVQFQRRAPGLFEADIALAAGQPLRIEVQGPGGRVQRIAAAAGSDRSGETQVAAAKALDLAALAERTGGALLSQAGLGAPSLAVSQGELSFVVTRIWPLLLLAALLAYLGELLYRRWPR